MAIRYSALPSLAYAAFHSRSAFRHSPRRSAFLAAAACDLGAAKAGAAQRKIAAEMANARIASPLRRSLAAALAQAFAGGQEAVKDPVVGVKARFQGAVRKDPPVRCPPSAPPRRCARPGRTPRRRCA